MFLDFQDISSYQQFWSWSTPLPPPCPDDDNHDADENFDETDVNLDDYDDKLTMITLHMKAYHEDADHDNNDADVNFDEVDVNFDDYENKMTVRKVYMKAHLLVMTIMIMLVLFWMIGR